MTSPMHHPPSERLHTCTIKVLPLEKIVAAAKTAIEVNPANAPRPHLLQMAASQGLTLPPEHLAVVTQKYWGRRGVHLTVGFLDNPAADLRSRILSHMNAWGAYCNVSFVESSTSPQVRIARVHGGETGGYWSYLGTDILQQPSDQPTMNLDNFTMAIAESEFHRVVRHETGHTLGYPHEHTRSEIVNRIDRDKAIAYFTASQGWSQQKVIDQVLTPLNDSALLETAHADPNSIMCYWLPGSVMKDGKEVTGGTDIDAQDQAFAATVYPLTPYKAVYAAGAPGNGIGGYDLKNPADRAFAFDYGSSGKLDHICLYRPGTGTFWILRNSGGSFSPVYHQGAPGNGIGGYDLKDASDQAFAFDYDSSGKLDHICLYRPGTGTFWILKNNGGNFTAVYHQGAPGNGIGGYDLKDKADRAFAFDYDHSGKLDHLCLYRPGTGTFWILKNSGGNFSPVFHVGAPGNGIGGYDLKDANDQAFAFDYTQTGKLDHICLYRAGTGTFWIIKNTAGNFSPVFHSNSGIGGYDLKEKADRAFALDYQGTGKLDHLALYRPGTGTFWVLRNTGGTFAADSAEGAPGIGVGGYDLMSSADRAFAFDYDHSGKLDHLVFYRPGTGTCWVLAKR